MPDCTDGTLPRIVSYVLTYTLQEHTKCHVDAQEAKCPKAVRSNISRTPRQFPAARILEMSNGGDPITEALVSATSYTEFRAGQKEAIDSLWSGHHTVFRTKPAGGKSAPYQIFTWMQSNSQRADASVTVVIEPLVSIAEDSASSTNGVRKFGFKAVVITGSGKTVSKQLARIGKTQAEGRGEKTRIVFTTIECVLAEGNTKAWEQIRKDIALVVFDEPDVAVVDGKRYRHSWLQLGRAHKVRRAKTLSISCFVHARCWESDCYYLRVRHLTIQRSMLFVTSYESRVLHFILSASRCSARIFTSTSSTRPLQHNNTKLLRKN